MKSLTLVIIAACAAVCTHASSTHQRDSGDPEDGELVSLDKDHNLDLQEPHRRIRRYAHGKKSRYTRQSDEEEEDPYDYRSDYNSRPKSFDSPSYSSYTDGRKKNHEDAEEDPYNYGSDAGYDFKEYERIKSLSEAQAAEVKRNPENCKEEARDGMTCHVCKDPKTGGNFESCSYVSEPKNNKYAYSKEKKFDSNDQPDEVEEDKKPANYEAEEISEKASDEEKTTSRSAEYTAPKTSSYSDSGVTPSYKSSYKPPSSSKYAKLVSAEPIQNPYQKKKYSEDSVPSPYKRYHSSLPNRRRESLRAEETDESESEEAEEEPVTYKKPGYDYKSAIPGFYTDNEQKKDVEHVLAEFKKKDRSSCNKINKNGMTCFQCIDKTGLKHEECMFISESAPKKSHLAYQELKEFTSKPPTLDGGESDLAESRIVTTTNPLEVLGGKNKYKKYTSGTGSATTFVPQMSDLPLQRTPHATSPTYTNSHQNKRVVKRSKYTENDPEPSIPDETRLAPPEEFAGIDSKGAFWADLEPRYSKTLGVSLPQFMITRSEHELAFDDSVTG